MFNIRINQLLYFVFYWDLYTMKKYRILLDLSYDFWVYYFSSDRQNKLSLQLHKRKNQSLKLFEYDYGFCLIIKLKKCWNSNNVEQRQYLDNNNGRAVQTQHMWLVVSVLLNSENSWICQRIFALINNRCTLMIRSGLCQWGKVQVWLDLQEFIWLN